MGRAGGVELVEEEGHDGGVFSSLRLNTQWHAVRRRQGRASRQGDQ